MISSEFGTQQAGVGAREEQGDAQARRGESIAVGFRDALDDAVQAKPAQIVGHSSHGVMGWVEAQQLSQQGSHFLIGETPQLETEQDQYAEQRLHARIAEAQRRSSLPVDFDGADHLIERVFANRAIVRYGLDVEKTSVGLKADLPQSGQVIQPLADAEVACVVDGGFGAQRAAFLVVLLDARVLVVDVQRRDHPVGDHARAEAARRAFG